MAGSRRPSTSRLTPFSTTIRIAVTLFDQGVESAADDVLLQLDADAWRSRGVQQDESHGSAGGLLVAGERRPRRVAVDLRRLRAEELLDRALLLRETREPHRGEKTERDRLPVRQPEAGGCLERMREGVAEIQLRTFAAIERVAEADRRLERRRPANLRGELELPEGLSCQQPGLDHLGPSVLELLRRQCREELRVDDDPGRPVERPHEVFPALDVDRRLAPDRRVHLRDQSRRDGNPGDAAQEGGGDEAGEVARRAASEHHERLASLEPQGSPQSLRLRSGLRALARQHLVRPFEPLPERGPHEVAVELVDARIDHELDVAVVRNEPAEAVAGSRPDVDACCSQDRVLQIARVRIRDAFVQRRALLVEGPELRRVARERPHAGMHAPPSFLRGGLEQDCERMLAESDARQLRAERAASELDDCGDSSREGLHRRALLQLAERVLTTLREEIRDRDLTLLLDDRVDRDERPAELRGETGAEGRLPGAHEADERNVAIERVQDSRAQRILSRYARRAAMKSASASPPNFSSAARASSHATAASATTASASTACTSLRSTSASPGSPLSRSTERSGRMSVGNGFIAARTTTGSPFVTPPSRPPARFVCLRRSGSISSWASDPRRRASAKPSPSSTPLTAWIPISAAASRESSRFPFSAYEPSPGGTSSATISTMPPRVSRARRASSVAVALPSSVVSPPTSRTRPVTEMPISARSVFATAPAATCAAVCLALARSRALRASSWPNFRAPARSA